jgi:hypothetical protein
MYYLLDDKQEEFLPLSPTTGIILQANFTKDVVVTSFRVTYGNLSSKRAYIAIKTARGTLYGFLASNKQKGSVLILLPQKGLPLPAGKTFKIVIAKGSKDVSISQVAFFGGPRPRPVV